jgi:predicted XRE-type DNA-binding protein
MEKTKQEMIDGEEGTVSYGSGNVFADMGLSNPDERLAKAQLAGTIRDIIQARGLTQHQAADLMGTDQPKVSKIIRGRLREFSTEWLLSRVLHMGLDVDIVIHTQTKQKREGAISVACV